MNCAVEAAKQWYTILTPKLAPTNVPFSNIFREPFLLDGEDPFIRKDERGAMAHVQAQFRFVLEQPSNRLVSVSIPALRRFVETNDTQPVASLTASGAVERADSYLKIIGLQSRHPLILRDVQFNSFINKNRWCVSWEPVVDGYRFDTFLTCLAQWVGVGFHEKYGFISFGCGDVLPPPRTTEVRIDRESAVAKGEKAVPLVMRTPFYRMCRDTNFKAKSLKKAELLIAAPNWLLDSKRAVWMRDKPPEETRLCWVVTFETVATRTREGGLNLVPPDILIYIDAATGEVVGANFT